MPLHFIEGRLAELRELFEEDGFRELLEAFDSDVTLQLQTIRAALAKADADSARRAAHGLKGAAINVGALELAAAARAIEQNPADAEILRPLVAPIEASASGARSALRAALAADRRMPAVAAG